jgi:two-component system, OmpR family, response regulator
MPEGTRAVLLVEDEEDICWALERILARMDFCVSVANNGAQGLELASCGAFAAALVDAKLPDIEGMELARQVRERRPHLPLILISGYFFQADIVVRESIEDGLFGAFVSKPFDASEIGEALRAVLGGDGGGGCYGRRSTTMDAIP